MKAKAETSAVLYANDYHLTTAMVNLEGGIKERKDLKTFISNLF